MTKVDIIKGIRLLRRSQERDDGLRTCKEQVDKFFAEYDEARWPGTTTSIAVECELTGLSERWTAQDVRDMLAAMEDRKDDCRRASTRITELQDEVVELRKQLADVAHHRNALRLALAHELDPREWESDDELADIPFM